MVCTPSRSRYIATECTPRSRFSRQSEGNHVSEQRTFVHTLNDHGSKISLTDTFWIGRPADGSGWPMHGCVRDVQRQYYRSYITPSEPTIGLRKMQSPFLPANLDRKLCLISQNHVVLLRAHNTHKKLSIPSLVMSRCASNYQASVVAGHLALTSAHAYTSIGKLTVAG